MRPRPPRLTGPSPAERRRTVISLVLVFALGACGIYLADGIGPRRREASETRVVSASEPGIELERVKKAGPRGLSFMEPRAPGRNPPAGESAFLEDLRSAGLLRAFSEPAGLVSFDGDGREVLLPAPPPVSGPVEPRTVFDGPEEGRRVALTFDTSEVSEASRTRALIDELTRLRAPATFFVCGGWCRKNPSLLRLLFERGFEVASHSYDHPMFTRLSNEAITSQLDRTEEAVREIAARPIAAYFRPPYGDTDARVERVAADNGYTTVIWSADTLDWHPSTIREQIRDRATVGARGGDIVLMHTLGNYTRDALVEIVPNLRAEGFTLTTLSGVLEDRAEGR